MIALVLIAFCVVFGGGPFLALLVGGAAKTKPPKPTPPVPFDPYAHFSETRNDAA